jgi:hypothetical protein
MICISTSFEKVIVLLDERMKDASIDLRFLLNRRYDKARAIKFVGNKYQLDKSERHILYRALYSDDEINAIKKKLVPFEQISGKHLVIDGYNVLITVESILHNKTIINCDDGVIRDVSGVFGSYVITPVTNNSLNLILSQIAENPPTLLQFFFDSQVSKSGELSKNVREKINELQLNGDAETVKHVDTTLKKLDCDIVATSDTIIIAQASAVVDIPQRIVEVIKPPVTILKLS